MRIKKLLILGVAPILLSSYMFIASISVKEPLEIQSAVVKNEKISKKHADKMKKICKSKTSVSIKTIKKINSDKILVSSASSAKELNNEKIVKKQFENKKRNILNTMNELRYKKRDLANKLNELTSEIELLQDFALTGKEKKHDFYFSVSGGKTHSSNPNAVVSAINVITEKAEKVAKNKFKNAEDVIDIANTDKLSPIFEK